MSSDKRIIPDRILTIGKVNHYFLVGPHTGNKKYRVMWVNQRGPMDEIRAVEDAHFLDELDITLEELDKGW